jgi:hypothetical protein
MKKFMLITVAILAACSRDAEEPADTAAKEDPEPAAVVPMGQEAAGTYNVKRYNGGTSTIVINADGTYSDNGPGGTIETGRFALKDGKRCFDPEGDEAEVCWTVSQPRADGSFTATDPEGHIVTLMREAETASPAAARTTNM